MWQSNVMPQQEFRRSTLSIVEKAAPCRYHRPMDIVRPAETRHGTPLERHQTPIPALGPPPERPKNPPLIER
jgi:hypothetical protein